METLNKLPSVKSQYEDAAYSRYVQSRANASLYNEYIDYSFFQEMNGVIESRKADDGSIAVLDLGCGNAVLGRKLLKLNLSAELHVTGIDQSTSMLKEASRLCQEDGLSSQLTLIEGSVTRLPQSLAAASFDVVMSGFVIVHMETETMLQDFFVQVAKSLKSGGRTLHINPVVIAEEEVTPPEGSAHLAQLPILHDETGQVEHTIELYDHFWSTKTMIAAARAAGLVDVSITTAKIDPKSSTWTEETLPVTAILLSARKP
ncbi:expressed unknown protein [Seminavis robusta]|uniref:Methyltransferase domain-containing protein n=1 Tax=Seminavis robusta TaxID=568900 RepID=A0A9N8DST6_9STRA|nr:expressed unknown protein [Seminavis robusta]|eukprot:Sro226_g092110.1 n/a (260) ;mRNA; f:76175-76954